MSRVYLIAAVGAAELVRPVMAGAAIHPQVRAVAAGLWLAVWDGDARSLRRALLPTMPGVTVVIAEVSGDWLLLPAA